ncbi:hypothetical protein [Halorussus ruber]|uniref:hypothetical protein n=1 Tax=Halorussus ruber TaxID=1126238 RepID=UPI001091EA28|nr:hypothetical protein [Halorussus ruber]
MSNLKETFSVGGVLALGLFVLFYLNRLQAADTPAETVDVFTRSLLTILFIFVPTSELGAVISISAGTIGAAISMESFRPKVRVLVVAFGFFYTLTNIIINWFTVPV